MGMIDAHSLIEKFKNRRVLVVGDVMLDEYIEGVVDRISPEAPIPVLLQKQVRHVLGGAGNVAANVAALGARVTLIGIIGSDGRGRILQHEARKKGIITRFVVDGSRPTTTKIRFVSGHHQLVRIDVEETHAMSKAIEMRLIRTIQTLPPHDVVIVSDYAKGVLTKSALGALRNRFGAGKIIADMKPVNAHLYAGIYAITPNVREAAEMTGVHALSNALAARVSARLMRRFKASVILTRGDKGISAREKGSVCLHMHNVVHSVKDVTGAGDTLVSVFALAKASGAPFHEAAELANYAAGIVVGMAGTIALSIKELRNALQRRT